MAEDCGWRALVDGGFTRLRCKWDTAGADRFIVNAAAWSANSKGGRGQGVGFS